MYLWNDLLQSLTGNCTAVYFFEDKMDLIVNCFSITFDISGSSKMCL